MSTVSRCRSCESTHFDVVLDLGETPLANALLTQEQCEKPEKRYSLTLLRCRECSLLQISENVPAEELFSQYFYQSSFSASFLRHCKDLAMKIVHERGLGADSLVIDIASNDGYLLQFYTEQKIPVLGIEPAKNIAPLAVARGIPTRHAFFTAAEALRMQKEGIHADVIHANNVMPHVSNQKDFAEGIRTLLKPEGVAIIEFAYAIDTIEKTEFDQVYHEHMCYFSLTSFQRLCEKAGLTVVRAEKIPVHGGSLRVFLMHSGAQTDSTVQKLLQEEVEWGIDTSHPYSEFRERVTALRTSLLTLLKNLKSQGKRIAVYGASAKGSTLMNAFGITKEYVEYIVDRSTAKQGFLSPGTHLQIFPVEKLLTDQPDYTLLLTWNFAEEILEQQAEYRRRGGKFIVPVPDVRVV